jgi:DNA-binding XRE family transcriptional regulator
MRESKNAYQACFDVAKRLGFGRGVLFYRMNGRKQHGGTRMTLRAMRERAGLSQQDLRAKVGINSVSYFWALEAWDCTPRPKRARDPHTMRLDTAKKVSEALGVSLDELWDGLV